jgi:hypothetical protein
MKLKFFLLFASWLLSFQAAAKDMRIGITKVNYNRYLSFLANRNPLQVSDFSGPHARLEAIEPIILQQALNYAKYKEPFHFGLEDEALIRYALTEHTMDVYANTVPGYEYLADKKFISSNPVVAHGEFYLGLYTSQKNKSLQAKTVDEIRRLRAVTVKSWLGDIKSIKAIGCKVVLVNSWDEMIKAISAGDADFMISPFPSGSSLSITVNDKNLQFVPIPNFKTVFVGDRKFVAANTVHSLKFMTALNAGIKEMQNKGLIRKYLEQSGVSNPKVAPWKVLTESTNF